MSAALRRGLFVVFEGCDRTGKSTQVAALLKTLSKTRAGAVGIRFPNRSSATGQMIDKYLKGKTAMSVQAMHLIFSANRWEDEKMISETLASGKHVVCDRYSYSGMAYSRAQGLDAQWTQMTEVGLPVPDVIFYLKNANQKSDMQTRTTADSKERYDDTSLQARVAKEFDEIFKDVPMDQVRTIDVSNRSISDIESEIASKVQWSLGVTKSHKHN